MLRVDMQRKKVKRDRRNRKIAGGEGFARARVRERTSFSLVASSVHRARSRRGTEEHALHLVFSLSVPPPFVCFLPTVLSFSRFFPRGPSTFRPAARFALLLALCKVKNCLGSLAATRRDPVRALGHWLCHRHPRYQLPPSLCPAASSFCCFPLVPTGVPPPPPPPPATRPPPLL